MILGCQVFNQKNLHLYNKCDSCSMQLRLYLPSCLGQETAKGPFGLRVKLPPVYHTQ